MLKNLSLALILVISSARRIDIREDEDMLSAVSCKAYTCKTSNVTIPSGSCGVVVNSNVYLKPCSTVDPTTSYCNYTNFNFTCTATPTSSSLQNYPGEPCSTQSDCKFGTCTKSVCTGVSKGSSCVIHEQCSPGLRCSSGGVCVDQLAIGVSGCRSYADCVNYASCNATYSSSNGVCTQYHSVANGLVVTDCENGFSEMCATGYCIKTGSWFGQLGTCAIAPTSTKTMPVSCAQNTDCLGTDGTNMMLSSCQCGYNSGAKSYCSAFIGDTPGQNLLSMWLKALKASASICNTVRRDADPCLSLIGYLDYITAADFYWNYYSQVQGNDLCVQNILTKAYWAYATDSAYLITFGVLLISLWI
ncbi:unnamed protein product [Blepharisma stoltei]|uniref:Uncharacterized protein n=1 Tax=Blepharisma stoltei TaxID=1481888 RepID=A0AAU9IDB5_9CILI|nr:unnamed protein product [Blepharisma stoltei]